MSSAPEQTEFRRELYRDELNFAEFPLASVSTSLPKDQKTLEFSDEIFDRSTSQRVTRKLTITASDKYGLPTAMDDEVILGLMQLTGRADFAERKIFFTRYELLKLLNWTDDTRNYNRLEQSLKRWLGVTLYYDNAWWSKEEQSWVSEGFHILDHVTIMDKERQRRTSAKGEQGGKSSFVWNEVVFNSFKAGYLKQLDWEFYKGLESAISKRMYRFLDKRFYQRQRLEFNLRTFACEHVGLSKRYHNGELKRVLGAAIAELEEQGFLKKLSTEERFVRQAKGEWTAVFIREGKHLSIVPDNEPELVKALAERGVSRSSARNLVKQRPERDIEQKIAVFDWLRARKDRRIEKNPAGFLYQSIAQNFDVPEDFLAEKANVAPRAAKVVPIRVATKKTEPPSDRAAIDRYWSSLGTEEQERIERELLSKAPSFTKDQYREEKRGLLFQAVRQAMIDGYVRAELNRPSVPLQR